MSLCLVLFHFNHTKRNGRTTQKEAQVIPPKHRKQFFGKKTKNVIIEKIQVQIVKHDFSQVPYHKSK